jgi:hypothetical protein
MRCTLQLDAYRTARLTWMETGYTEALPMTDGIVVHGVDAAVDAASIALAAGALLRTYVGESFELELEIEPYGGIGLDVADALRLLLGPSTHIGPVLAAQRTLSTRSYDVVAGPAARFPRVEAGNRDLLLEVAWSGDFVDPERRTSIGHRFGTFFTNAALVADDFSVSVALALLAHGPAIRRLYVAPPAGGRDEAMEQALACYGITLVSLD